MVYSRESRFRKTKYRERRFRKKERNESYNIIGERKIT